MIPGWSLILKLVGMLSGVNISGLINGVTDVIKNRTNAEVADHASDNASGVAIGTAYLNSVNAANSAKLENKRIEGKWGPTVLFSMILFATPFGIHTWAVVLDSMNFLGHVAGSWSVEKLPGMFEQTEHAVIQSMFYIGGTVGSVAMLAKAFGKR